jgi:hypothetical protein
MELLAQQILVAVVAAVLVLQAVVLAALAVQVLLLLLTGSHKGEMR